LSGSGGFMQGKRAVVIGAGLAGLMAARVLADHYDSVVVIEKDQLTGPEPRKGVPQGNHIHVLWSVGSAILERLFPGLFEDLAAAGGVWNTRSGKNCSNMATSISNVLRLLESVLRMIVPAG